MAKKKELIKVPYSEDLTLKSFVIEACSLNGITKAQLAEELGISKYIIHRITSQSIPYKLNYSKLKLFMPVFEGTIKQAIKQFYL